jgi:hypothetical protein
LNKRLCYESFAPFVVRIFAVADPKLPWLVAVAGIAKELQPYLDSNHYFAGLWSNYVHRGLLWSPFQYRINPGVTRYKEYIAPSWSWASIDFPYKKSEISRKRSTYDDDLISSNDEFEPLAEIVDISMTNVNDDPFGPVKSGSLALEAECLTVCSCRVPTVFMDERQPGSPAILEPDEDQRSFFNVQSQGRRSRPRRRARRKDDGAVFNHGGSPPIEYPGGIELRNVRYNQFKDTQIKNIGTQECRTEPGAQHEALVYGKIATLKHSNLFWVVVAGLILEPIRTDNNVQYRRVGRVLMKPEFEDNHPENTRFKQKPWPVKRLTII